MTIPRNALTHIMRRLFDNPYLLLCLTTLFWAGNAIAGKLAVADITAVELTFYRWFVANIIMLPLAWRHLQNDWPQIRQKWPLLLAFGGIGFAGFNLSMYWALNYTSVVNVVIEQAAIPVLIMLFNFVAFRLKVRILQLLGLGLALLGVVLTVTRGEINLLLENAINLGDAIMMFAALCYAAYSVGLRWRPKMHWLSFLYCLSFSALLTSSVFFIPLAVQTGIGYPSLQSIGAVLYVAIFPSLLAQLFYARGIDLIGANRAGLFINLVPIFGSVLAIALLGEVFRWYHMTGLILVVGGIFLAERAARRSY